MVSVGQGASNIVQSTLQGLGTKVVFVTPGTRSTGFVEAPGGGVTNLTARRLPGARRPGGGSRRHRRRPRRRDILGQLLVEAVVLTIVGRIAGITLGISIALVIWVFRAIAPAMSPFAVLVALLIGMAVGLVFGLYPVRRASVLQSIAAPRAEWGAAPPPAAGRGCRRRDSSLFGLLTYGGPVG